MAVRSAATGGHVTHVTHANRDEHLERWFYGLAYRYRPLLVYGVTGSSHP
jgi:hypothetical protein